MVAEFALGSLDLELLLAPGAVGRVQPLEEDFSEFGLTVAVGSEFLFLPCRLGFIEGAAGLAAVGCCGVEVSFGFAQFGGDDGEGPARSCGQSDELLMEGLEVGFDAYTFASACG